MLDDGFALWCLYVVHIGYVICEHSAVGIVCVILMRNVEYDDATG